MARLIRASEVGEYVFCHRAWWLHHVEGHVPRHQERLDAGVARHTRHGLRTQVARGLLVAALAILSAGLVLRILNI